MTPKIVIELQDVWKSYVLGDTTLNILKGVFVEIHRCDFVAILCPSGGGKSTLMNQVGLLDIPTKGKIYLEGKDITHLTESELATARGKKIGFVFQQFNLLPTLTAVENVILPTIFQNVPENERRQRAVKLLASVGLQDRMHHKPMELSGGQQQRVAIARALVNNPDIILADEPTGNLDSVSGRQIMDLLTNLHKKEGKTIILVTHDIELVKYSTKTIYIKDGEIVKVTKNGIHSLPKKPF